MNVPWKKVMKWAAGKAFTWGLKKLTELSPDEVKPVTPLKRTPKHKKPYVQ